MSTVSEQPSVPGRWRERLGARDGDHGGRGRLYRAETIVLAVLAVVLTTATVYDLVRQVHVHDPRRRVRKDSIDALGAGRGLPDIPGPGRGRTARRGWRLLRSQERPAQEPRGGRSV